MTPPATGSWKAFLQLYYVLFEFFLVLVACCWKALEGVFCNGITGYWKARVVTVLRVVERRFLLQSYVLLKRCFGDFYILLVAGVFRPLYVLLEGIFLSVVLRVCLCLFMSQTLLQWASRVERRALWPLKCAYYWNAFLYPLFNICGYRCMMHVVVLICFIVSQVAKKYNLYTKVTGGQRIDMFGAEKHQVRQAYSRTIHYLVSTTGIDYWCRLL